MDPPHFSGARIKSVQLKSSLLTVTSGRLVAHMHQCSVCRGLRTDTLTLKVKANLCYFSKCSSV